MKKIYFLEFIAIIIIVGLVKFGFDVYKNMEGATEEAKWRSANGYLEYSAIRIAMERTFEDYFNTNKSSKSEVDNNKSPDVSETKVYEFNPYESFAKILMYFADKPIKGKLYFHYNDYAQAEILQVFPNEVLIKFNDQNNPKTIMIKTNDEYVTSDSLKNGFYEYIGIETYNTANGGTNTVRVFKSIDVNVAYFKNDIDFKSVLGIVPSKKYINTGKISGEYMGDLNFDINLTKKDAFNGNMTAIFTMIYICSLQPPDGFDKKDMEALNLKFFRAVEKSECMYWICEAANRGSVYAQNYIENLKAEIEKKEREEKIHSIGNLQLN